MAGDLAGRLARLYVGTVGTAVTTGSLTDGSIYFVKAKAAELSGIDADLTVGDAFIADDVTLVTGDIVYPLTLVAVGLVKDKGASYSKGTIDATADGDDENGKKVSNQLVTTSISFSGNNSADSSLALATFEKVFNVVVVGDGSAGYAVNSINNDPLWLVFDYTARGRASAANIKTFVVPALLTSLNINAPGAELQDFSADGESAGSDALGNRQTMIYGVEVSA